LRFIDRDIFLMTIKLLNEFTKKALLGLLAIAFLIALFKPFLADLNPSKTPSTSAKVEIKAQKETKKADSKSKKVKLIEKPLHKVSLPDFASISSVKEKKRQFFNFLRPAITRENQRLLKLRQKVLLVLEQSSFDQTLSEGDLQFIDKEAKRYRINKSLAPFEKLNELIKRIDIIPKALILVQAANESAWGTSRFARVGLNFFGLWCYKKGCGMVPNGRNVGAKHEVASFSTVDESVQRYIHNINSNNAYNVFRNIRVQLHQQAQPLSAQVLAAGLLPYSERGADYVLDITEMLRHNKAYFTTDTANTESTISE